MYIDGMKEYKLDKKTVLSLRVAERYPETEMARFAEYCLKNLMRTKRRDYPPSRNEVIACLVSKIYGVSP